MHREKPEFTAAKIVTTWVAGGMTQKRLTELQKDVAIAIRQAQEREREAWLRSTDNAEDAQHVITSLRKRFPKEKG